ncbi:MAG TPA: helix-turn-helix domain-containing protein [Trueperaceae bacterium]|nr:helix-turn-helix domain-containing protein [Trueperaceae bacterium]
MNLREEPPEKLTLHQAADALNASTAHVKGLLEQGLISHHGEGARLRVDRDSLLAYKARDDQERQAALDELTREAQDQGYGY